jgi:hypothetical protein
MRKAIALSAASAALLAVVACKNDRPASTTSTTSAGVMSTDDAVAHLTARRCDHEIDCKNVGAGRRYDDRGGCEREITHELQAELGRTACSYGVREDRVQECMTAIRGESCATAMDTMSTIATCRTSALCIP